MGDSGSGKTTLICALVSEWIKRGHSVSYLKHTHHMIVAFDAGDTGQVLAAGARAAILAGEHAAAMFMPGRPARKILFDDPAELLMELNTEKIVIEGYKSDPRWPKLLLGEWRDDLPNVIAWIETGEPRSTAAPPPNLPRFRSDEVASILQFLDTIAPP